MDPLFKFILYLFFFEKIQLLLNDKKLLDFKIFSRHFSTVSIA